MKVSSVTDPEMLRREVDECMELLARASFSGIIALLMEHTDTCRIMADRLAAAHPLPDEASRSRKV